MKKLFLSIVVLALTAKFQPIQAQEKLKEGKITFEISYPESEDMNDQMLAMMPKDMTMYFKNGKSRTEMKSGFYNTVSLYDPEKKEAIACMEMMGRKNAIKTTDEEAEKDKEKSMGEYTVNITNETKKIAGYKATKAIITFKSEHEPIELWFTSDLAVESSGRYSWKGINGVPLESTMEQKTGQGSLKMKLTCTKVEKMDVSDDMFKIPEGYKLTTREEMMKQFQEKAKEKEGKPDTEKKDTIK